MVQRLLLAAALVLCLTVPDVAFAQPILTLTGEFKNLLSHGCYPVRMDVTAAPRMRTFALDGFGVTFYPADVPCTGEGLGNRLFGAIPADEGVALEVNMQRDLARDTRVEAIVQAAVFTSPDLDAVKAVLVTYVDPAPLIAVTPSFSNPSSLNRHGCYTVRTSVYPETLPITVLFTSSVTNGVPDLEIHRGDCDGPLLTSIDLPAGRSPFAAEVVSFRVAPGNEGTTGTLIISSPTLVEGVGFAPVNLSYTFTPLPVVTLTGQFENLLSRECYPIRVDVRAAPEARQLALGGGGVVFHFTNDVNCEFSVPGNRIDRTIPAGEPFVFHVKMRRDLENDTRTRATISAVAGSDGVFRDVTFVDPAPLITIVPIFGGATNVDRNGCHFFFGQVFPENAAVTLNFSSSATRGVPDLEIHGNGCDVTPIMTALDLAAPRDLHNFHYLGSVRRAPKNAGTTGTLIISSPTLIDGVPFKAATEPYTFKPRATLSLTAPATTNLAPNACVPATVRVGTFDFASIRVRLYSGTGNARVYDSAGCLTTLPEVTLAPGGSRTVWLKPVAPDVPYASLIADTLGVPNVEPTKPTSAGLTFYFIP